MGRRIDLYAPWSLRQLVADLSVGNLTTAQAEARARRRIAATECEVRAWVDLEAAPVAPADHGGLLAGVPMGIKDIIDLRGFPTRCGSQLRQDIGAAEKDASIVAAWRETGALPLGKTVTTEFAFFAPGPTRNPAAPDRTPGGSSSGSAAAVAAGHVPLAIGSQTAGSVTRPAAYCGVASLVMTRDRFPTTGVVGLAESLDSHGIYTATVDDLALAWSALTHEPDVANRPGPVPRFALWTATSVGGVSDVMTGALDQVHSNLTDAGVPVESFNLHAMVADITAAHPVVMAYEAARERAEELDSVDRLSKPLAALLHLGAATSRVAYETARTTIRDGSTRIGELLADEAVIIGPAAPSAAPEGLGATGDPVLSRAWQALGLAVVTVPGLRDPVGLPLGLQVIARSELDALRAAIWVERSL